MLTGTYSHALDSKGRLIIPAKLREELGDGFVITKNMDRCLSIYPKAEWDKLTEKLNDLPLISSEPARKINRLIFGNSSEPEVDKQGRILIPADLRKHANLSKDVTLVGANRLVEVWDTATWNDYNEHLDMGDIAYNLNGINL
ncbi:MAG: division/cell wall cluster transcriptional repressor MraZ [Lachnospiraceae bacterium]|nr:division/cell wall cluster transcriptional repressor MraZ [Lachnospiraceae bacterium]MBR5739465.1 division/cell wall cluster transcriptional repressor MraZ [Lachnospiraceae bacterium]